MLFHGMEQGHRFLAMHSSVYSMLLINCNIIPRIYILKGKCTGKCIRKWKWNTKHSKYKYDELHISRIVVR